MISKRQRRLAAGKALYTLPTKFEQIDLSTSTVSIKWLTRAYRNNRYTIMIDDNCSTTHGNAILAMIQKHNDTPILNHWKELQNIKNEIFGSEAVAVEYYPSESKLMDYHNIYWIWIYPSGVLPIPIMSKKI